MKIRSWLGMWVVALLRLPEALAQSLVGGVGQGSGIPGNVLGVPASFFEDGMLMLRRDERQPSESPLAQWLYGNRVLGLAYYPNFAMKLLFENGEVVNVASEYPVSASEAATTSCGSGVINDIMTSQLTPSVIESLLATLATQIQPTPALQLRSTEVETGSLTEPFSSSDDWLKKYRPSESYPDPTPTLSVTTDDPGEDSGRYWLAMQGSNGIEVSFEIEPSKARVVSFSVETMGASNGFEKSCTDEAGGGTAETSTSTADSRQPEESPSTSAQATGGSIASVNRQLTEYGGGNKQPVQVARRYEEPCPARISLRKRRADTKPESPGKRKKESASEAPADMTAQLDYGAHVLYQRSIISPFGNSLRNILFARELDLQANIRPVRWTTVSQHCLNSANTAIRRKATAVRKKTKGVTGTRKAGRRAKDVTQSVEKPAASQINVRHAAVLGLLPGSRLIISGRKYYKSNDIEESDTEESDTEDHREDHIPASNPTAISVYNEHWSSVEVLNLSGYINKVIVIDETQFLMLIFSREKYLYLWKEINGKWSNRYLGVVKKDVSVSSDKKILTRYNVRRSINIRMWTEHDEEWCSETLISGVDEYCHRVISFAGGRVVSSYDGGSLRVWYKKGNTWAFHLLPRKFLKPELVELDKNAVAIYNENHVGIWRETGGHWSYINVSGIRGIYKIVQLGNGWLVNLPEPFFSDFPGIVLWTEQKGRWKKIILDPKAFMKNVLVHEGDRLISWPRYDEIKVWSLVNGNWQSVTLFGNYTPVYQVIPLPDGRFVSIPYSPRTRISLWHEEAGAWSAVLLKNPSLPRDGFVTNFNLVKSFLLLNDGRLLGSLKHNYAVVEPGCRRPRVNEQDRTYELRAFHLWNLFPLKPMLDKDVVHYDRIESEDSVKYLKD